MSDNIKVCCRFRQDKEGEELDDWEFELENHVIKLRDKKFVYDEVLDMNTSQEEMYQKVAMKTIDDFCNGYHGTIFAYGNSGSGKTFSIVGPDEIVDYLCKDFNSMPEDIQKMYGVIPRATVSIFNAINEVVGSGGTVSLVSSYIEIYNESITCLLNGKENLKIHEIPKVGFQISGKEERICLTPEDVFKVLYIGTKNKTIGGTAQNARSSRSHTLLTLELKVKSFDGSERNSKLNIVDLAGSEKLRNTGANTPERLKEAQKINLSLTTLGMCIMALTESASFVPFRNSKLTLLLKESLGGNSKTTLLCAARRDKKLVDDNLNSLYFAQRAKSIKTKSVKNIKLSEKESEFLIAALKGEIIVLRKQVVELGQTFKPITDPKLLQLLDGDIKDEGAIIPAVESDNSNKDTKQTPKRQSLINLSEQEIILKYCELRAKYDNLMESAGNKIFQLTNQVAISGGSISDSTECNRIECKNERKLLAARNQELEKNTSRLKRNLEEAESDYKGIQEMMDLTQIDIDALTTSNTEKDELIAKLQQKDQESSISIAMKEEEIMRLEKLILAFKNDDTVARLETENSLKESKIQGLEFQVTQLTEDLENFKLKFDKMSNENNNTISELNSTKASLSKDLSDSELKRTMAQAELDQKQSWINAANLELDALRTSDKEKVSEQEVFKRKDELLQETKRILEERIMNSHQQIDNLSLELSNQKALAKEDILKLSTQVDSYLKEISELKISLEQKNSELANLRNYIESREKNLLDELSLKNTEIGSCKIESLENEKKHQSEMLRFEENLMSKSKLINELQDKNNNIQAERDKQLKQKDSEKEELTLQAKCHEKLANKLDDELRQLSTSANQLKSQISSLETEKKMLYEVLN